MKISLAVVSVYGLLTACGISNVTEKVVPDSASEPLPPAASRVIVLSGGDSPSGNHFSQYLQAKLLDEHVRSVFGEENTSVLFGAGNREDVPARIADVHRMVKVGDQSRHKTVVGNLKNNKAANKENVSRELSSARYEKTETLFLLVGDHGMPNRDAEGNPDRSFSNNCINLWGVDVVGKDIKQREFKDRCLTVKELKSLLLAAHPKGKTVFAMSQCFSGGFHQMSVEVNNGIPTANTNMCGFTAVTQDTWASGCTPDADGPTYQGYERYLAEELSGKDVVSGAHLGDASATLEEAHARAVMRDFTVDIPLRTSDYYLWQWSQSLRKDNVTLSLGVNSTSVRKAFLDGANFIESVDNEAFASRTKFVVEASQKVGERYPEAVTLLKGDIGELEKAVSAEASKLSALETRAGEAYEKWSEVYSKIATAWRKALSSNSVPGMRPEYLAFEHLWGKYDRILSLSLLTITDPASAETLSEYMAIRPLMIFAWAKEQPELAGAVAEINALDEEVAKLSEAMDATGRKHGMLRRIAIYRSVLGSWVALHAAQEQKALSEIDGLVSCEHTRFQRN